MSEKYLKKISNFLQYTGLRFSNSRKISAILVYHGISKNSHKNCVPMNIFKEHMIYLKNNFKIISLSKLLDILELKEIQNDNLVAITFDDAYKNFFRNAYPILLKYNIPATVYIPANLVGQYNNWDFDNKEDYSYLQIMSYEEIKEMDSDLIELGSHTANHKRLSATTDAELITEINDSKNSLENALHRKFDLFAYPYGGLSDYDERAIKIIRSSNYRAAVTTHFGRFNDNTDMYNLKRISIYDDDLVFDLKSKLLGYYDWLSFKEQIVYSIKKLVK